MADPPGILIVEDEQIVASDLEHTLRDLGYAVAGVAASGEWAIEMAGQSKPDLVLMDIDLQGRMNGVVAAEEIDRLWHIPVVFLTANTSDELLLKARAAGAYGYLIKPLRREELHATLLVALRQHQLARELFSEHEWLRTMLESLTNGVIATDTDGRVRYLNAAAGNLTGWPLHEAVGQDINDVFSLCSLGGMRIEMCQLRKALLSLKPAGRERFILLSKDGRRFHIEDSAAPIVEAGIVIGAVSVFSDISESLRREREAAERKDRLEEQVHLTTAALGETRTELRALSGHLMTAQEEERRRVARELHDDLGQRTALVEMQLTRALEIASGEKTPLRDLLLQIREQIGALSTGLRTVSHGLHPSVLVDLGLVSALRRLIEDFCESGGDASARLPQTSPELSLEVATALYRIAQEALRNAVKHAPGAPVRITLDTTAQGLQLTVEDAGPGFDLNQARAMGGLGLLSMQERARLAGGTLFLNTQPGDGTTVTVRIPTEDFRISPETPGPSGQQTPPGLTQ